MIGPSSSHTAGMARIGRVAHQILPKTYTGVRLTLHSAIRQTYRGHRTDVALIGGLLGIREDDPEIRDAMKILRSRNVSLTVDFTDDTRLSPNTVRIETTMPDGSAFSVTGVSVGGGSIAITNVDGFDLAIDPSKPAMLVFASREMRAELAAAAGRPAAVAESRGGYLYAFTDDKQTFGAPPAALFAIDGVSRVCTVLPVLDYGCSGKEAEGFDSFETLLLLSKRTEKALPELALTYETTRSGKSRAEVLKRMQGMLAVMRAACEKGLSGKNRLNGGLVSGEDGRRLLKASEEYRTVSGPMLSRAMARAIATMEVNGSTGCVVASPTAGSCGILPGCLVTLQEQRGLSDDTVVDGLLTAALIGVIMERRHVSFSGVVGGCQAEIGVSSAITAAALAQMGGGSPRVCVEAAALAVKNLLGLICDPIAGPVEVPCIKRNSVGVANAFAAADMALAGIESYIPPDEVLDALVDTQKRLPTSLKGTAVGGLASTKTACRLREQFNRCSAQEGLGHEAEL